MVKIGEGPNLKVQGNILVHEYDIREGRSQVAEVSKKWFRIRDTYGVTIQPGQNDVLIIAVTMAIDAMAHPGQQQSPDADAWRRRPAGAGPGTVPIIERAILLKLDRRTVREIGEHLLDNAVSSCLSWLSRILLVKEKNYDYARTR